MVGTSIARPPSSEQNDVVNETEEILLQEALRFLDGGKIVSNSDPIMMGSLQAMYILTEIVSKRLKKMVNQEVYETLLYMLQQDLSELHEE